MVGVCTLDGLNGPRKNQNEKYRLKYMRLRKAACAMIFENAALYDGIAHLEEKFVRAKEERRFLLKSLLQYQSLAEGESVPTPSCSTHAPVVLSWGTPGGAALPGSHSQATGLSGSDDGLLKKPKKERKERGREKGREERDAIIFAQPFVMKKICKKRKVAEGGVRKLVQPISLDSSGRPVFPIVLGGLTVYSLGEVRNSPSSNGIL
uniref:Transforming growth factor beta regulator 1 n=1 Tax=Sinocyclocheilus grahami TaxID=75366 RepID=A0A672S267_SINGR